MWLAGAIGRKCGNEPRKWSPLKETTSGMVFSSESFHFSFPASRTSFCGGSPRASHAIDWTVRRSRAKRWPCALPLRPESVGRSIGCGLRWEHQYLVVVSLFFLERARSLAWCHRFWMAHLTHLASTCVFFVLPFNQPQVCTCCRVATSFLWQLWNNGLP